MFVHLGQEIQNNSFGLLLMMGFICCILNKDCKILLFLLIKYIELMLNIFI